MPNRTYFRARLIDSIELFHAHLALGSLPVFRDSWEALVGEIQQARAEGWLSEEDRMLASDVEGDLLGEYDTHAPQEDKPERRLQYAYVFVDQFPDEVE